MVSRSWRCHTQRNERPPCCRVDGARRTGSEHRVHSQPARGGTSKGNTWTQQRVGAFRHDHGIAVYRDGERAERGEVTLAEAASRLAVSRMTVIRLIKGRLLPAKQACIGAPYVIRETDLDLSIVRHAIENGRAVSADPRQGTLEYQ